MHRAGSGRRARAYVEHGDLTAAGVSSRSDRNPQLAAGNLGPALVDDVPGATVLSLSGWGHQIDADRQSIPRCDSRQIDFGLTTHTLAADELEFISVPGGRAAV